MNDMAKNLLLWVIIAVVLLTVFQSFNPHAAAPSDVPYSDFTQQVSNGSVASVALSAEDPTKVDRQAQGRQHGDDDGADRRQPAAARPAAPRPTSKCGRRRPTT